ncbi:MAG: recombination-associated protein RdgC [Deltaproteobacteria bacterium]|nr:recombination-associated protein RdgC [Deltaproteobacteria bacterium]
MGIILGSGSFTRFRVQGDMPRDYKEKFPESIKRLSFRNFDEYSEEERSVGWVNIMNMFDVQSLEFEYLKPPYISLSWRVDVRNVPRKALKQHCFEAEEEIKSSDDLEYLPKARQKEIKDWVWRRLLKRAIPRSNSYDAVWNLESSMLLFGSTNSKLGDEFAEFFSRTFELRLTPVFPYSLAVQYLEKEEIDPGIMDTVRTLDFAGDRQ